MKMAKTFTITKKISKHGSGAVIVIPRFLQNELKPRTIVEVRINIVKEAENDPRFKNLQE